jgi:hypothetical protein
MSGKGGARLDLPRNLGSNGRGGEGRDEVTSALRARPGTGGRDEPTAEGCGRRHVVRNRCAPAAVSGLSGRGLCRRAAGTWETAGHGRPWAVPGVSLIPTGTGCWPSPGGREQWRLFWSVRSASEALSHSEALGRARGSRGATSAAGARPGPPPPSPTSEGSAERVQSRPRGDLAQAGSQGAERWSVLALRTQPCPGTPRVRGPARLAAGCLWVGRPLLPSPVKWRCGPGLYRGSVNLLLVTPCNKAKNLTWNLLPIMFVGRSSEWSSRTAKWEIPIPV